MAVSPGVKASTQSTTEGEDQLSPTTLIMNAIRAQGKPITNENIRRMVESNARESKQDGPDPVAGLRSSAPEDSGPVVGKGGSSKKDIENQPAANLGTNPYPVDQGGPTAGGVGVPGAQGNSSASWMDGLVPAIAAAVIQGVRAIAPNGFGGQQNMGNQPMPPTGRMMDVDPTSIGATPAPPGIEGPPPRASADMGGPATADVLGAEDFAPRGPAPGTQLPSPMQQAMDAAIQSRSGVPQLGGPGPNPMDVIGKGQQLPAGINPMSVPTTPPGPMSTQLPANMNGAPQMPEMVVRPQPGLRPQLPMGSGNVGKRILSGVIR